MAALTALASAGCSDGLVAAGGTITVDGLPATQGQVFFIPIGGGEQAFASVEPSGAFSLRTVSGEGVPPGEYRVMVKQKSTPELRGQTKLAAELGLDAGELAVTYTAPPDQTVPIPEGGAENLSIEVSREAGWQYALND